MKVHKKARTTAPKALARARAKYAKRLKKVERGRARLERATQKLRAQEVKIAKLADRAHQEHTQPPGQASTPQAVPLRRACLIFNPRSKGASKNAYRPEQIVECLRSHGIEAELGLKTSGKVARALAKSAVERKLDLVIVAAGDGSIEDVVPALVGSQTALGIVPIGTMNNIARSLGVPLTIEEACALLGMGLTRAVDVGRVITDQKPKGAYFLETAGIGLSALAAPLGQDEEKGRWAMMLKTLGKLLTFDSANMSITCDDGKLLESNTQVVTVSNAPLFGKNMLIAPEAKIDDGLLDVALYDGMSRLDLERHFLEIADGKRADTPKIAFQRVRSISVRADRPLAANADLEILTEQPNWTIDVLPGALVAVVGKGIALSLPVETVPAVPPLSGPQPAPASGDSSI